MKFISTLLIAFLCFGSICWHVTSFEMRYTTRFRSTVHKYMHVVGKALRQTYSNPCTTIIEFYFSIETMFVSFFSKIVVDKLSFAIKNAEITHSTPAHFVPRPKIGEKINHALSYTFLDGGSYTIVYGPRGVGKSELVDHMAIGKKGVMKVQISSVKTLDEIIQSLSKDLLGEANINPNLFMETFKAAIRKSGIIPTIIIDVECSIPREIDILIITRSLCQELGRLCRCIIVVPEPHGVLQFYHFGCEEFIYVDEMERDEATQLLEKLDVKLDAAEMNNVFDTIGTSPITLMNLADRVTSTYSVKDYVADVLRKSSAQLVAFRHQQLLKALKDHPEGVDTDYFLKENNEGKVTLLNPMTVGPEMKAVNAIVYRKELHKYMLMSTAHRTALQSYEPILTK